MNYIKNAMKISLATTIGLFAIALIPGTASQALAGQSCSLNSFYGTVTYNGVATNGATVTLTDMTNGAPALTTTTSSGGVYQIESGNLATCAAVGDQMTITASFNGFSTSTTVSYASQSTTQVNLAITSTASSAKAITAFSFATPAATGVITGTNIAITVPNGTNVTALIPTIAVSANATVSPTSGTAQNFTSPVTYTVTAQDATTQTYTVTVTVAAAPVPPTLTVYTVSQTAISPNASIGVQDTVSIDTAFSEPSHITINIKSGATLVKNLYTSSGLVANPAAYTWDGKNTAGTFVADGIYTIEIIATNATGGTLTDTSKTIIVDNTPPTITAPANITQATGIAVVLGTPTVADNLSTPTVTNNAPATFPVGVTTVTWTATDAAGNSATATQTVTITALTKTTPTITWANPATIVYGTALSATELNASSGGVAGTFAYTPIAGTVLNVGANQTLSVVFTPTDTATYNSVSATVSITVTPAVVIPVLTTIAVTPTPASIVVGATQQFTAVGKDQNGTALATQPTFTWTSASTSVATINSGGLATAVSVGTTTITASSGAISGTASVTVTAAPLIATSVSVNPIIDVYGATVNLVATLSPAVSGKTITFSINGVVKGTATTNASGIATSTGISLVGINAGTYATGISASFAGDTTYAASNGSAALVINKMPITVTATTSTKVYDGTTSSTGIPTITTGALVGTSTAIWTQSFDNKNVGTGKSLIPSGTITDGAGGTNYLVTFVNNTTGVITAKALTITANNVFKTFGATLTFNGLGVALNGLVSGDNVTSVTLTSAGAIASAATSTYPIVPSAAVGASITNYTITYVNGVLTVNDKQTPAIVWSNPADIFYPTPLSSVQLNATTSVAGTFVYTPAAGTVLHVGASQNLLAVFTPTSTTTYNPASTNVLINVLATVYSANANTLPSLLTSGALTPAAGSVSTSTPSLTVNGDTTISISDEGNTSVIILPSGTIISLIGGGLLNASNLSAADATTNTFAGMTSGTVVDGALQWGISGVGLQFSLPITLKMFVGTGFNGQTLNVIRSVSGNDTWTSDGIVAPATCVVANGLCIFQATKASYYAATSPAPTPAPVSSGGGGGSIVGGGGGSSNPLPGVNASSGTVTTTTTTTTTSNQGEVLGANVYHFGKNLAVGSRGADVTALQQFLIDSGYSIPAGATGYFGSQTRSAVMAFQKAHGIVQVGNVGPLTRAELNKGEVPTTSETSSSSGLTASQVNSILTVLQSFGVDQATMNQVRAAL